MKQQCIINKKWGVGMKFSKLKKASVCFLTFCLMAQSFAGGFTAYAQEDAGVVIDATDYGADPTGEEDSAQAIWTAFEAAKEASENGTKSVTVSFPKGEYHIYKDYAQTREYHTSNTNSIENPTKTIGLLIENQENFTLDGNGSLFMMHGNMMALAVVHSKNVTLKNFSWDFGVPTDLLMGYQVFRNWTTRISAYFIPPPGPLCSR